MERNILFWGDRL